MILPVIVVAVALAFVKTVPVLICTGPARLMPLPPLPTVIFPPTLIALAGPDTLMSERGRMLPKRALNVTGPVVAIEIPCPPAEVLSIVLLNRAAPPPVIVTVVPLLEEEIGLLKVADVAVMLPKLTFPSPDSVNAPALIGPASVSGAVWVRVDVVAFIPALIWIVAPLRFNVVVLTRPL